MALTDSKLKNLKPADKVYKVVDRDGMYVVVSLKGTLCVVTRLWMPASSAAA